MANQKNTSRASTTRRAVKTFGVLLLLVVFPLTSWYFLQSGLNFAKQNFNEMDSLGTVQPFSASSFFGDTVSQYSISDKAILLFGDETLEKHPGKIKDLYEELLDQEVAWMLYLTAREPEHENFPEWMRKSENLKVISQSDVSFRSFGISASLVSDGIAMVDSRGVVRNIYSLEDDQSMNQLLRHFVLLVPKNGR